MIKESFSATHHRRDYLVVLEGAGRHQVLDFSMLLVEVIGLLGGLLSLDRGEAENVRCAVEGVYNNSLTSRFRVAVS